MKFDIPRLLLAASFFGTFSEKMVTTVLSVLTQKSGGSLEDIGSAFAVFSIAMGITVILLGKRKWYQDNLGWMVLFGFAVSGLGDLLFITAHSPAIITAIQAMNGIAVGLLNPAWDALFEEHGDEGASKWADWTGGISLVEGVAAFLGGYVAFHFGFTSLFLLIFALNAVAIFAAFKILKGSMQLEQITPSGNSPAAIPIHFIFTSILFLLGNKANAVSSIFAQITQEPKSESDRR